MMDINDPKLARTKMGKQRTGPRWVTQTTFYDPERPGLGNCTEACVASLLGLTIDEVPRFWDDSAEDPVQAFWLNFHDFFRKLGWEVTDFWEGFQPEGIVMWSGPSQRGCDHMVLAQNGVLIHDPHPSRQGLLEVKQIYALNPINPLDVVNSKKFGM